MSRPLQRQVFETLDRLEGALCDEDVRLPYKTAKEFAYELEVARAEMREIAEFVDLALCGFDVLEGLAAAWPDTGFVGLLEEANEPVLMRDEAIKQAVAIIHKSREDVPTFTL